MQSYYGINKNIPSYRGQFRKLLTQGSLKNCQFITLLLS